ncbi:hypothetical protein GCM10020255_093910 [Rhodococcus baikonurensis]
MSKAEAIIKGLGGAENIVEIEACITRLRTEVKDGAKVNESALKAAGARRTQGRNGCPGHRRARGRHPCRGHRGHPVTVVLAPLPGRVVALADVPDPVFAQQMVGSGVAIEPARGQGPLTVVAPISGKILKLHPHAFVIFGEKATGVLVHIGIDTVKLEGDGFTLIAAEGDTVNAGDPVVSFDPAHIDTTGYSAICPVVVMDSKPDTVESPPSVGTSPPATLCSTGRRNTKGGHTGRCARPRLER